MLVPEGIPPGGPLPLWQAPSLEAALAVLAVAGRVVYANEDSERPLYQWRLALPSSPPDRAWPEGNVHAIQEARELLEALGARQAEGWSP